MKRGIVSRDDSVYECFPDLAATAGGTLVCVYRECMGHAPAPFSRLVVRRSTDSGETWSDKQVLHETVTGRANVEQHRHMFEDDALAAYEDVIARMGPDVREGRINGGRLAALQNGASIASLLLTTDAVVSEIPEKKEAPPAMPPGGGMY